MMKPNEDDTRLRSYATRNHRSHHQSEQHLNKSFKCLEEPKRHPQMMKIATNGAKRSNSFACVCSAVILLTVIPQVHNVHAEQQELGGAGNHLVPHHLSHSQSALFKDLSGPTSGKIQTLDVICGKNFMTVRAEFSGPFYGIVFSKGTYGQENCIYVKPNSGLTHAAFNVYYDQCGTKPDLQGKFYENTIVIQYGSDIIEAYDEAKRLRCEWFEAYEKPATFKPAIPVADLEVVEMNFQGDDIDCWMEIQEGSGPWSREVSKIVPVGQPMTIVVAINDYTGVFDMRVKSCVAHDGVQQPISLTDEFGCVLRPKMLTPFQKIKNPGGNKKATILSYSRFLAFKFPDSMNVQIQCTVEVCRHGCADSCQRIPSIAATTMQPELSLTARWPAASPGRRYEATAESREQPQQYKAPPRMQLGSAAGQQRPPVADSWPRVEAAGVNPRAPQQFAPSAGPPREQMQPEDSMSSSDSNQQPSIQAAGNPNTNQRRSQDSEVRQQHQYLVANSIRNRGAGSSSAPSFNNRPSVAQMQPTTTSTTTTSAPPTSPQATSARDEIAPEVGATEEQPLDRVIATSGEQPAESNIDKSKLIPTSEVADSDQQDNEAKASQVKHSVVSPPQDQEQQQQQQSQSGGQQSVSSNVNEQSQPVGSRLSPGQSPSGDELAQDTGSKMQDNTEDEQIGAESAPSSSSSSSSSSLKTVEVEIPANEDPVRALIANSGHNNQFNSVRLSNVELNSAADKTFNGGYKHDPDGAHYNPRQVVSSYSSPDQVIQPREQVGEMKRSDKSGDSESSSIEAMMANGKSRFGARSQPQAAVQASAAPSEQPFLNHQMASGAADQGDERQIPSGKDEAQQVNPDRVLIDRSDDSSSLTELSSSGLDSAMAASNDQASIAKPDSSSSSQQESAVVDDGASSASGTSDTAASSGKVKPVVGTEELASGPLQIEDRIGAPAPQDSLEEALSRLQQQVPQSAALVNSEQQAQSANPQQQPQEAGAYPSSAPEAERRSDTMMKQADNVPEKLTERADTSRDQKLPMTTGQQQQLALKQQAGQQEVSQPYPNVVGQVKVIPDPMSSLNARGSMLAQASNVEGVANGVLSLPAGAGKQPTGSKPPATPDVAAQQQQSIASKPVAQITNVPINIGFPPSQIPAIQQISQQLAYFQQQQQMQQQQQQPKVTTAKPSRGRFGLISPQAALQAVASRFLPKSTVQAPAQQQHHQLAMSPQLMSSINKLSPEQQQKLFAAAPLQTPTQPNQFAQTAQQQQQLQNRFTPPQVQQQQKSSLGGGLFRRFNQQQPLVRSRRSAIMPNGKRGSGEVGMTKTFMVVTGMDLAFMPNTTDTELPPILEGRRLVEDDVIYGVCMPVVSLTFVLTCAFWLIVFVVSFCIYMLIKARKLRRQTSMSEKR